jgi:hypothetical protein
VPEGQPKTGPKNFVWASKILVTGPNGIMVAHKFLVVALAYSFPDVFNVIMALISPYTNQPFIVPINGLASFLETTLDNGVKVDYEEVILK